MIQRPWAFWRRVQYAIGFFVVLALIGTALYFRYGYAEPTCFDGIQNADERGIDCGGACENICALDITLPISLWAESFRITEGQYNVVAYIENRNEDIGSPSLTYTFRLYDDAGLIVERSGTTVLPPNGVYPVFEGRVTTGERVPTRTTIELSDDIAWKKGTVGREQFALDGRELLNADSQPRLMADIRNTLLTEAEDVEIVATIFDKNGNPLTVARTVVEYFPGRTTESVTFTWPEPIAKTLRSCEIPTDVVLAIDLSGSMNNDGGVPPEPITSVLTAARAFISGLNPQDTVGVVTFATGAEVIETLTNESTRVAESITELRINPKEETGNTNTGEGLKLLGEELNSSRHNPDARKIGILLTDGLATAGGEDPEVYAQDQADKVKGMDIDLFTIGLGSTLNEEALKNLASTESQYYNAPSIRELSSIYDSITKSICEDGAAVIEIIAKPGTSFQ